MVPIVPTVSMVPVVPTVPIVPMVPIGISMVALYRQLELRIFM